MVPTGVVVIVEYPSTTSTCSLEFRQAETAIPGPAAAEHVPMTALFLPLAPIARDWGFLAHVPDGRVLEMDTTVDDAVQVVITSAIATERPGSGEYRDRTDEERA